MPRFELIAIDLDGTLFDTRRDVPEDNRQALGRVERSGVRIAVVTGRRPPAARASLEGLGIDPVLVFNSGALIQEGLKGPIIRRRFLPRALAKQVLAVGRQLGVEPIVHVGPNGEGQVFIETAPSADRSMAFYVDKTTPPPIYSADLMSELEADPLQVGFAATVATVRRLAERIESSFAEELKLARTEYPDNDFALLDVLAPEATKAEALRFLARRYAVVREKTMAIGDNWNDLEMLETAGFAVVMANAPRDLLSRGFAMTASNDEAGVARALERYVLRAGAAEACSKGSSPSPRGPDEQNRQ